MLQAGILGYLHWEDGHDAGSDATHALWEAVMQNHGAGGATAGVQAITGTVAGNPETVFYPPEDTDGSTLTPLQSDAAHTDMTASLDGLWHFLRQLSGQAGPADFHPTPLASGADDFIQQASTQRP